MTHQNGPKNTLRAAIVAAATLLLAAAPADRTTRIMTDVTAHLAGVRSESVAVLKAAAVKEGSALELAIRSPDGLARTVGLSSAQLLRLALGGAVQVESSRAGGFSHSVLFDPGNVADGAAQVALDAALPQVFLHLGEVEAARLHVGASLALQPDSVAVCTGTAADCPAGGGRWRAATAVGADPSRFVVEGYAPAAGVLRVRAKTIDGAPFVSIFNLQSVE